MATCPGFIKSLIQESVANPLYDHYVNIEWDSIPMLSIITGVNGIGKSTLMKMMVYYFNQNKQLNYKFELQNGLLHNDLILSLLHFDNNVMDLRLNNFTRYNSKTKHIEFNFSEQIKTIDLDWIRATSISKTLNTPNEQLLIQLLKNEFVNFDSFEILKEKQFNTAIHWGKCFPKIESLEDCNSLLKIILNFNGYKPKAIQHIGNIKNILLQNILNLHQINEMIKESDFHHSIFIIIKSKIFFENIHQVSIKSASSWAEMEHDQQQKVMKVLKSYIVEKKENGLTDKEFQTMPIDDLIKLLLCRRKATLKDLNKSLKDDNFQKEIYLEIYFDIVFTTDQKMNQFNEKKKLSIDTLSNGEQIKFLRILWQFLIRNKQNTQFDKKQLLILDEPDSHLHPTAVHELAVTIKKLVEDLEVQVILTTHSPHTVSFFDEPNLFLFYERSDNKLELRAGVSRHEIIRRLTSQLVLVDIPHKTLYVEGYDAMYYKKLADILKDTQYHRISKFNPNHLNIITPSKGYESCSPIVNITAYMKNFKHIFGLVDGDGNQATGKIKFIPNLFYLERYAKENYYLDPLNVYFYLKTFVSKHPQVPKIDCLIEFLEYVEKELSENQNYSDFINKSLKEILYSIYNNESNKEKCIKYLQEIIEIFGKKFRDALFKNRDSFFGLKIKLDHLFQIHSNIKSNDPLCFYEMLKKQIYPESVNNFHKILQKHKKIGNQSNNSEMNNLIDELQELQLQDNIKRKSSSISIANVENYSLCDLNFDLTKCSNKNDINAFKYDYIEDNITKNFSCSIEDYFKSKTDDLNIKNMEKIRNLEQKFRNEDVQTTKDLIYKELETILFQKKTVFINNEQLSYPNLFINTNGHDLEDKIYYTIFPGFQLNRWRQDLIDSFDENGVFIPDDLVRVYRILCNNLHEIKAESFEYQIFNSNENWFVRFTTKQEDCLEDLNFRKAAYEFNGMANFGFYLIKKNPISDSKEKLLFQKLGLSEKIQPDENFLDQLMYFSCNVVYENTDFSIESYDQVSTDLFKFCNSKVANYGIKEINEHNFYSELSKFNKPRLIKFVHYESFKDFSNFIKIAQDLKEKAFFGIFFVKKKTEDSIINRYKLNVNVKKYGKTGFVLNFGDDFSIKDNFVLTTKMTADELKSAFNESLNRIKS